MRRSTGSMRIGGMEPTKSIGRERRALQIAVALGSLIPISAGGAGAVIGPRLVDTATAGADLDSHFCYLSGLLLGIGLAFAASVPTIERHGPRFRLLATIVVIGGLARLLDLLAGPHPSGPMQAALVMELAVTPVLALWQRRIARLSRGSRLAPS